MTEAVYLALLTAAVAGIGAVLTYLATRRKTDLDAIQAARDSLARELRGELDRLATTTDEQEHEIQKLRIEVHGLRLALEGYRRAALGLADALRVHDPAAAAAALAALPDIPHST